MKTIDAGLLLSACFTMAFACPQSLASAPLAGDDTSFLHS